MDIPAIQVVKSSISAVDGGLFLSQACELYLRLKGVGKDKVFMRTANRNTTYVTKLLGDRPISYYSSNEAAQFRDWCIEQAHIRILAIAFMPPSNFLYAATKPNAVAAKEAVANKSHNHFRSRLYVL